MKEMQDVFKVREESEPGSSHKIVETAEDLPVYIENFFVHFKIRVTSNIDLIAPTNLRF